MAGACTSVAVDLGDLEGRHPDVLTRWEEREKKLEELLAWHTFKLSSEQVCMYVCMYVCMAGGAPSNPATLGTSLSVLIRGGGLISGAPLVAVHCELIACWCRSRFARGCVSLLSCSCRTTLTLETLPRLPRTC